MDDSKDTRTLDMLDTGPDLSAQVAHPVVTRPANAPAVQQLATTPMELLSQVTARGATVEEVKAFMDLMERQQANEARQAFVRAMAAFKKNPPDIYKTKSASFQGKNNSQVEYNYADLGAVCDQVIAALAEHGISHDWSVDQPDQMTIVVSCTLTHEMGHSKSTTLRAPPDQTGSKNPIQAVGSAVSYLQRYSLLAVCGIAVKGQDNDGASAAALDTTLADKWIAKVKASKTDDEVAGVIWPEGAAALEAAKDRHGYGEFKKAVAERRAELAKGAA